MKNHVNSQMIKDFQISDDEYQVIPSIQLLLFRIMVFVKFLLKYSPGMNYELFQVFYAYLISIKCDIPKNIIDAKKSCLGKI